MKAGPGIRAAAVGGVEACGLAMYVAHLTLGTNPTGTITFTLYGPNDATCTVVAFTDTKLVSGNADYTSSSFTAIQAGTYHWRASYSGDRKKKHTSQLPSRPPPVSRLLLETNTAPPTPASRPR